MPPFVLGKDGSASGEHNSPNVCAYKDEVGLGDGAIFAAEENFNPTEETGNERIDAFTNALKHDDAQGDSW